MLARSIASFAIAAGESIRQFREFCLKPFANCVVIETNRLQRVCLPPEEDAISVGTQWSHMLERLDFAIA